MICLLRYGQLLEQNRHSWINTTALITGCTNAAGLVVVGNFQVPPPHLPLIGSSCLHGQHLEADPGREGVRERSDGWGREVGLLHGLAPV